MNQMVTYPLDIKLQISVRNLLKITYFCTE